MSGDSMEGVEGGENNNNNNHNNKNSNNVSTERQRYLKERVEKKEEQVLKIEANVFQVANYYFVFQGVILTAVTKGSSSSSLKCKHVWIPLSLTLIGAVVNLGALLMIADKYREPLNELDTRIQALYNILYPHQTGDAIHYHQRKKARRNRILVLSTILFSVFAIINLVAAPIILCF